MDSNNHSVHHHVYESTGTFEGHIIVTVMFLPLGLWWMRNHIETYVESTFKGKKFEAQLWYSSYPNPSHPVESIIKTAVLALKVFLDFIDGIVNQRLMAFANHSSMEIPFLLASGLEALTFYGAPIHPSLLYWAWIQGYSIQLVLAVMHSMHTAPFEKTIHIVGAIPIIICIVGLVLQLCNRHSLPAALLYPMGVILQSLWFLLIAFALYSPLPSLGPWIEAEDLHLSRLILILEYLILIVFVTSILFCIRAVKRRQRVQKTNIIHVKFQDC